MAGMKKETKEAVKKALDGVIKDTQELADGLKKEAGETIKKVSESDTVVGNAVKETKEAVGKVARKTGTAARKTVKKAKQVKTKAFSPNVKEYIQYAGKEYNRDDIMEMVYSAYEAADRKRNEIKDIEIYIKPEDHAAYYVINGNETGKVYLD